jgi:hypothetical protein
MMMGLMLAGCCGQLVTKAAKTEPVIAWQAAPGRAAELNGRHYYLLEEGFTCSGGMIPGMAEPSWREHVSISDGQLLDWGSLCNDTQMLIGPVDTTLEISSDLSWLRYQDKVYRHYATPPLPLKQGERHE